MTYRLLAQNMVSQKAPTYLTARLIRTLGDTIALRHKGNQRLCIVNYHRVLPSPDPLLPSEPSIEIFRWHMALLAECFNVLSLSEAIAALDTSDIPPRAICITFDDGYRSIHDLALPVLKEFNLPATVFVASGYIDRGNMWNDRIIEAVQSMPAAALDLRALGLGIYPTASLTDRKIAVDQLTHASKYLPPQAREKLTRTLEEMAGDRLSDGLMLTRHMMLNLAQHGIEIGGHTVSHPILTRLEDEHARYEIAVGKQQLEEIIGKPVRLFAYPNGKVGMDFDERHVRMVREAGFSAAVTTTLGATNKTHDRYQLPRSRPWDATPLLFGLRLLRWLAS